MSDGARPVRAKVRSAPSAPGCYRFLSASGEVLYVGKAADLKQRLSSYLAPPTSLHPRTAALMAEAHDVDWVEVLQDASALQLEWTLIHRHRPRYNVKLQDDRRYPEIAVTADAAGRAGRVLVSRSRRRPGERRYGPYRSTREARALIDAALPVFKVRSCDDATYVRAERDGTPCVLAELGRCAAPCVGRIGVDEHRVQLGRLGRLLSGDVDEAVGRLRRLMQEASDRQDFERAGRLRDTIGEVSAATAPLEVVWPDGGDATCGSVAVRDGRAAVVVLDVREGRLVGRHLDLFDLTSAASVPDEPSEREPSEGAVSEGELVEGGPAPAGAADELTAAGLLEGRLATRLASASEEPGRFPRTVIMPHAPSEGFIASASASLAAAGVRGRLDVHVPVRGRRAALLQLAVRNAEGALDAEMLRSRGTAAGRRRLLADLAAALRLPDTPVRVECYDISHFGGTGTVGSMVVFVDGAPHRPGFRTFNMKEDRNDDPASIGEIISRRFTRLAASDPAFTPAPDLVVIDGGPTQLAAATAAATAAGFPQIPFVALAKEHEELWLPGAASPLSLPPDGPVMRMVRHMRDEAHRTAISAQRSRRRA